MQINDMPMRQKIILVIVILIAIFVIWEVYGLIKNRSSQNAPVMAKQAKMSAPSPQMMTPQQASIPKGPPPLTPREIALMQLQQQTEEKYLAALTELQMLKVTRDIAETNKAIATARFDTVTAEKNTLNLLTGPVISEKTYAQGLAGPAAQPSPAAPPVTSEAAYVVISVSKLQGRWSAVLGYQGRLFTVSVGDVLPADGSRVISIDKSAVILEKDKVRKKISLVAVI